jgi:RHS repeat-associated protein
MTDTSARSVSKFFQWADGIVQIRARRCGIVLLCAFAIGLGAVSETYAMPGPGDAGPTDPAVSQSTGSANFRISIEVPPGPGGLVPNVALTYSSLRSDGPYGVGWDLDLGEIRCSTRFGIPDYAYESCMRYELDGQLLTRDGTTNSYHSFVETFQQIEYLPASKIWQVINPNGTILRYGVDPDARVLSGANIARWLLSEIEDPFGNTIFISYDGTIDIGRRYPKRVTYGAGATKAAGKRQVDFVFGENRPDPIHNYAEGIEQKLTKRLTEITVSSFGALVRRYGFGYSLEGVTYTTGRTRLSWVQEFGSDCTGVLSDCTGLPPTEYEYTDPNDDHETTEQFSNFDVDDNYVIPFGGGNAHWGVPPVRLVDINGDGLTDLIRGGYYVGGYSLGTVELNTGTGFVLDTAWTNALQTLQIERPRAEFTQIRAVSADELLGDNVGIIEATFETVTRAVSDFPMANPARPFAIASAGARANTSPGAPPVDGSVEALGRLFFTDVNADGLADIIVSVRLSGVDVVLDNAGNAVPPTRVSGRSVSMVFRNTGTGWVSDSELATGLPIFGDVIIESTYAVDLRDPWDWDYYWSAVIGGSAEQTDTCGSRGLRGWQSQLPAEDGDDVCIDLVNLDPVFTDFNGDGYPDVMVIEFDDPEALYRGPEVMRGPNPAPHPSQMGRSVAWVQVPDAAAGQPRWVRKAEFDLPQVDFGVRNWGDNQINPFAHSGVGRATGDHSFFYGHTANCPGGLSIFASCGPTGYNQDNGVRLLDVNRDGLTDVVWGLVRFEGFNGEDRHEVSGTLINTGTGWCSVGEAMAGFPSVCPGTVTAPGSPGGTNLFAVHADYVPPGIQSGHYIDLNADGWLDFVQTDLPPKLFPVNASWLYDPAGATWVKDERYDVDVRWDILLLGGYLDGLGFSYLDINGDGAGDVIGDRLRETNNGKTTYYPQAFISNSGHSDLIRLVRNGSGGEIAISYEAAIAQRDLSVGGLEKQADDHASSVGETINGTTIADAVRWNATPVVSEVKVTGPNRAPGSSTKYRYAHPRYCSTNRSDLGFRIVERVRLGGEVVTSKFYQVHGRAGKTSSVVVSDNDIDMHRYEEDWEIQPDVPGLVPGSIDDPDVHVGRLAEVRSTNLYAGGETGAELTRTFIYDDSYGHNFADRVVEVRPTGTLVNLRQPMSDGPNSIFGLVAEQQVFDRETANFGDTDYLKSMSLSYERGRQSSVTDRVNPRGDTASVADELHTMTYDVYGNLTSQTVHAPNDSRTTGFCYDGDVGWCPPMPGQDSHSVRVGVTDAIGGTTFFEPDAGTGAIVGTQSSYTDVPSTSIHLDAFGRPVATFVSGDDASWIRTSKTEYGDIPFQAQVITRFDYPEEAAADADAIWSSVVLDGFGGTWKEIGKTTTGFVATLTYHDPELHTVRRSLPVSCGADTSCVAQTGASEAYATLVETDGIGRPIRNDAPNGFSIFEYTSISKTGVPGATEGPFDSVLEKNGKGDVILRAMDGGRIAWVEECEDVIPAGATTIGSCEGDGTTFTYYSYEATGEISKIHDARSASSSFADPNHYLQYHYDTLGRVVQIGDPALSGARQTLTTYNFFGEIEKVTNARLEERIHTYDILGRLEAITTPSDEANYTISYRDNEIQSSVDASGDYWRRFSYDDLGRVQQEIIRVQNRSDPHEFFYTNYAYDLVGRVTEVVHPAKHYDASSGSWQNSIVRYEYDRGFLDQICDLGSAADCDSATTEYVNSVEFDGLGRQESISFPGGTRTFQYTLDTHRLSKDEVVSPTYEYTRNYTSYDGIGNILSITGSESASAPLDMNESYVYDERNRIQQWTKEGTTYAFDYDDLGNLTLHGGETQVYDDLERPHAVKTRDASSASRISYSYDDDGNVESILGGGSAQYFEYDSANQIVCLGATSSGCDTRVTYDINGKRMVETLADGESYNVYVGDAFLYEHTSLSNTASIEVMLDGKRIALKRFDARRRGSSTASVFVFSIPPSWIAGGMGGVGLLLILWVLQNGAFVLVRLRPLRAAVALGAAGSLLLPSIAMAGGLPPPAGNAPNYFWEISDPLGTGMVLLDVNGDRVRHQVFTPFGRIHKEVGANFRTFYAGHRRDEDSGMFYMQARWYDPGSGRFLSTDPLIRSAGVPQSSNAYSYTENNPVNGADPTGGVTYVNNTTDCGGGCTMVHFTSGSLAANSGGSVVGFVEGTNSVGEATTIQVTGNQFANMSPAGQAAFVSGSGQTFGAVGDGTFEAGATSFFDAGIAGGIDTSIFTPESISPSAEDAANAVELISLLTEIPVLVQAVEAIESGPLSEAPDGAAGAAGHLGLMAANRLTIFRNTSAQNSLRGRLSLPPINHDGVLQLGDHNPLRAPGKARDLSRLNNEIGIVERRGGLNQ